STSALSQDLHLSWMANDHGAGPGRADSQELVGYLRVGRDSAGQVLQPSAHGTAAHRVGIAGAGFGRGYGERGTGAFAAAVPADRPGVARTQPLVGVSAGG